ncbi:chaperone protein ClpB [Streptomyces sp. TS71-3]|nr:chaperone protein ClpB [Streptomyces sp. TS71-3]
MRLSGGPWGVCGEATLRPLFTDGIFEPQNLQDRRTTEVLLAAARRTARPLRPSDVLHAAVGSGDQSVLAALTPALAEGSEPRHLLDTIAVYNPGIPPGQPSHFGGTRSEFAPETIAALDAFAADLAADPEQLVPVALELLMSRVLAHPDAEDVEFLGILDRQVAVRGFSEQVRTRSEPLPALLEEGSGRLRSEEFTADAWAVLERAAAVAADLGYDRVLPPHCFLAMLRETEGPAERLVRLQIPPRVGLARAAEIVGDAFRLPGGGAEPPLLDRNGLGDPLLALIRAAQRAAALWGAGSVDVPHLLDALLAQPPARLVSAMEAEPLRVDLARMREHLAQELRHAGTAAPRRFAFRLAPGSAPAEDLTWLAQTQGITPALHLDRYFDPLTRALHRTVANNVLITGPPGVGATTLLRELARRAAGGEIPFLHRKRFVRVDCHDVAPAESGAALARIIDQVASRTDVVLCLDGLGALLRGPHDDNHVLTLRRALKEQRIRLVGVLSTQDHDDLLAGDQAMRELVTRIELIEPDRAAARDMARQAADTLEAEFGIGVDDRAVDRAVVLSRDYVLSQRQPLAAVRVLRRAIEDLNYERTQLAGARATVGTRDVDRVVAEISGVPVQQIAGGGGERIDYEKALSGWVFGQRGAVDVAASELRRIRAGLADGSGGPASVMLFAGLTGTGKTELAKAIARFYSASNKLQTYAMGNFGEPHSVSGIIGSPQGYIGYESGGRLIKELNADPYSVILLDEAEKAHPEVWRPFLNLFEEGWITDQRGVKAHGDRAIFILTTNAGQDVIARMIGKGADPEAIEAAVLKELANVSNHVRGGPVFTPELLARIRRAIIFRPLVAEAMTAICRRMVEQRQDFWRDKRNRELIVPESLIGHVAARGHRENEEANGKKGARVFRPLLSDLIDDPILRQQDRHEKEFERCVRIKLHFNADAAAGPDAHGSDQVTVRFVAEEEG